MPLYPDATSETPLANEIRQLETLRLQALVDADIAVAAPLHAPEFQLITPRGVVLGKAGYLQAIGDGSLRYHVFEPASVIAVWEYGGAVVIRYRSRLAVEADGVTLPVAAYWHTDVYERRGDDWQIVLSQATQVSEPVAGDA